MMTSTIIIDDYKDVTEVISEILEFKSINVLARGSNGTEAIELYKKHMPDVVIMDYLMPKFNGLYGLENIRKINPNAKVIIMLGSTNEKLHDALKKSGATAILPKPCETNRLMKTIIKVAANNVIPLSNQINNSN